MQLAVTGYLVVQSVHIMAVVAAYGLPLAYPLLIYFRSSHDNEAWINSFGAVMDASTLIMSSVEGDKSAGSAKLMATPSRPMRPVRPMRWT